VVKGKADDLYRGSMQFVNHSRTALQYLGIRLKINRQKLKHFNYYVKVKILLTQL